MSAIRAGVVYFCLVFGVGFVLGPIRVLWVVPRLGERLAELLEAPLMLLAIVLAARWTVRRHELTSTSQLATTGALALGLLLLTELTVVLGLRDLSLAEYLETRDPIAGTVYLFMLGVFAVMPVIVNRRSR